jgi:hypothetical protein
MQNPGTGSTPRSSRKPRKWLAPSEKYELFIQVLTQQATPAGVRGEVRRGPLEASAAKAAGGQAGQRAVRKDHQRPMPDSRVAFLVLEVPYGPCGVVAWA